jgi:tripartite-type tricarboxylate transporter receptor subunit TctC
MEGAMKIQRREFLHLVAGAAALPAIPRIARAQTYPTRPVRFIVGFPPGGAADTTARLVGQWLSERLGQPIIIENRAGAAGNIGTEAAVKAPADGYTLLLVVTNNTVNATLYDKLNFNFIRDIAPVASVARVPSVLDVNPAVPVRTVPELIAYAKANPGKLNMGSSGIGSPQHVSGELFKMMTGVNLVHVPYRGGALAVADLLAGQVQVVFDVLPESIGHIRAGKLRSFGGDHCHTFRGIARCPDDIRFRAGLRDKRMVRHWRAPEYARRNHPQAQQRDQRCFGRSQAKSAAFRPGRYCAFRHARRLRQAHRR